MSPQHPGDDDAPDPSGHTPIVRALGRVEGTVPPGLATLDALVAEAPRRPDDIENSVRVDTVLRRWRATYYWDVGAGGSYEGFLTGADVFSRFAGAVGIAGAEVLVDWLRERLHAGGLPGLVQLVVGIDERPGPGGDTRAKVYFIVQEEQAALLEALTSLFGVASTTPSRRAGRHLFYILGLDFEASGLADVKLYYALEPDRARGLIADPGPYRTLLPWTRRIAFRDTLLRPGGRQLIFDVVHPWGLWGFLEDEAERHEAGRHLLAFAGRMNEEMAPTRLEPSLLAVPWADRALATEGYNVYFHTSDGPVPAPHPDLQALHARRRERR